MKISAISLVALLTVSFVSADQFLNLDKAQQNTACYLYNDLTFFDLRPLMNNNSDYTQTVGGSVYTYNFCKYTNTSCVANSNHSQFAWSGPLLAPASIRNTTGCKALTNSNARPVNVTAVERIDELRHVYFQQSGGDECVSNSSKNYTWGVEVDCNPDGLDTDAP